MRSSSSGPSSRKKRAVVRHETVPLPAGALQECGSAAQTLDFLSTVRLDGADFAVRHLRYPRQDARHGGDFHRQFVLSRAQRFAQCFEPLHGNFTPAAQLSEFKGQKMGAVELDGLLHEVIAGADAGTPQIVVAQFQVPRGYRKP